MPMAAMPLVFAAQQAAEGVIWLGSTRHWPSYSVMLAANTFVLIALAFWPFWSPLAIGLMERMRRRRRLIFALLPVGLGLGIWSALSIFAQPYAPSIVHDSICYISDTPYPMIIFPIYVLCTIAPLLISSDSRIRLLGGILGMGLIVSLGFFYETFISVWCFFAAAASIGIFNILERNAAKPLSTEQATQA